jgi:hypothetical protein
LLLWFVLSAGVNFPAVVRCTVPIATSRALAILAPQLCNKTWELVGSIKTLMHGVLRRRGAVLVLGSRVQDALALRLRKMCAVLSLRLSWVSPKQMPQLLCPNQIVNEACSRRMEIKACENLIALSLSCETMEAE